MLQNKLIRFYLTFMSILKLFVKGGGIKLVLNIFKTFKRI